jgi:hypothetical protein
MAEMQGRLFVACTPQAFYTTTQIAVINTSAAKVITSVEAFERCQSMSMSYEANAVCSRQAYQRVAAAAVERRGAIRCAGGCRRRHCR